MYSDWKSGSMSPWPGKSLEGLHCCAPAAMAAVVVGPVVSAVVVVSAGAVVDAGHDPPAVH